MIQKARRQFILTASVAVLVVLLVVIGVINGTMRGMVQYQTSKVLYALSSWEEGQDRHFFPVSGTMLTNHFIRVQVSGDGASVSVEMARMLSLTDEDAKELADEALATGRDTGVIVQDGADFAFQITQKEDQSKTLIVFVDCTSAIIMMAQLMRASFAVGALSFIGFVLTITLLSRRAIRPVIQNMESQKRFITNAGHELKTPLAIISANAEVLEAINGENEWTQSILSQVEQLTTLVGRLIALSKLGEQNKPEIQAFSLSELTERKAAEFLPLAQQQGKALTWEIAPDLRIHSSEPLVRELESILLDNAVKYCDEGGTIQLRLRLSRKGSGAVLCVSNDYAAGESVNFDRFFERFYQEEQSHNSGKAGFGIGLSMAQESVRALKSSIRVEYRDRRITFRVGLADLKN